MWKLLETASQADAGMKLAGKKNAKHLHKEGPYLCSTLSLQIFKKVRFPLDVGGLSRDGQVTTELGTGSLRQAVGILNPEDFWPIGDSE